MIRPLAFFSDFFVKPDGDAFSVSADAVPASPPVAVKKNCRQAVPAPTSPKAWVASGATMPSPTSVLGEIDCGRHVVPPSDVRST